MVSIFILLGLLASALAADSFSLPRNLQHTVGTVRLFLRRRNPGRFLLPSNVTREIAGFPGCRSLTRSELELWALTNREREFRGKTRVRLSRSLTATAYLHALNANRITGNTPECNLHSWLAPPQAAEHYTPCCYYRNHKDTGCMHWKANQITEKRFPWIAYEVAMGPDAEVLDPAFMLSVWFDSDGHRAVILEEGMWSDYNFLSIGVAARGDWAMMWFGSHKDPLGFCGSSVERLRCHSRALSAAIDYVVPNFLRHW